MSLEDHISRLADSFIELTNAITQLTSVLKKPSPGDVETPVELPQTYDSLDNEEYEEPRKLLKAPFVDHPGAFSFIQGAYKNVKGDPKLVFMEILQELGVTELTQVKPHQFDMLYTLIQENLS